jgi:putative Holliday junction resolvase
LGLAICDAERRIASPLATYSRRNARLDAEYLRKLVADEQIVGIVLGLPIHNRGTESKKSKEARDFARWLASCLPVPIVLFDERFSTARARELLGDHLSPSQRKARLDKIAAQVILASFLESNPQHDWQQAIEDPSDTAD